MSPKTENVGSQYKVSINLGSKPLEVVFWLACTCSSPFEVDYYIPKESQNFEEEPKTLLKTHRSSSCNDLSDDQENNVKQSTICH